MQTNVTPDHAIEGSNSRCRSVLLLSQYSTAAQSKLDVLTALVGVSGLTTLKECLAKGFSATVFEALDHIGGQWHFTSPDPNADEVHSSIYEGVILNSCRDTTSFSDFPMDPAKYPDYFGHKLFLEYIHEYVEAFGLMDHVRLNARVVACKPLESGRWQVSYQQSGSPAVEETFDACFATSGHHTLPLMPRFEGQNAFPGEFMHSHRYRTPGRFEGKRVAIIGVGSSAVDISSEMCAQTKELHLITRRGGWIIPRYLLGLPVEAFDSTIPHRTVLVLTPITGDLQVDSHRLCCLLPSLNGHKRNCSISCKARWVHLENSIS